MAWIVHGDAQRRTAWISDKVRFCFDLFCCRTDVYALRWEHRRDGRSGWMPAIKGRWRKGMSRSEAPYLPWTPDAVDSHLRGDSHIGLSPLDDDDTCWRVAADFDKEAAMLDALAYMPQARSHQIPRHWKFRSQPRRPRVDLLRSAPVGLSCSGHRDQLVRRGVPAPRQYPPQRLRPTAPIPGSPYRPCSRQPRLRTIERQAPPARDDGLPRPSHFGTVRRPMGLCVEHRAAFEIGLGVRRLRLPTSSKIVPRPAAVVRAEFGSRITLTANVLGPAMSSVRNPDFDARQRQAQHLGRSAIPYGNDETKRRVVRNGRRSQLRSGVQADGRGECV